MHEEGNNRVIDTHTEESMPKKHSAPLTTSISAS